MSELTSDYTICAYMRLSKEDTDIFGRKNESGSITSQRRLIMDYISNHPEFSKCNVIERCDDGLSGRYFDTRPQFTEMIELAKKGKVNCIIVKDCSRFGRDYVELGDYLEQLFPFLGVRFIAINDHYDSDKSEGGLDIAFKNLVYDMYSRELSKKIAATRKQMAIQGKYYAGQTLYGYRKQRNNKHKLELDPETAPVVREIFDMRLAGVGLTDIARNLNDRGIKCASIYKLENGEAVNHTEKYKNMCWIPGTILSILSNEIYTGAMVAHRKTFDRVTGKPIARPKEEWIVVEGMHEAIVSAEEFRKVQDMIHPQKKPTGKRMMRYRCGNCGRSLCRRNGVDLYCTVGYVHNCECSSVVAKETVLDEIIINQLKAKLQRVLKAEEMVFSTGRTESKAINVDCLRSSLESAKKAKQKLFERLADRSIDREAFKEKKAVYDAEIADLEQRISDAEVVETIVKDKSDKVEVQSFLDIKTMTDEIWIKFLKDVFVFPGGRMEIHWNFGEEI